MKIIFKKDNVLNVDEIKSERDLFLLTLCVKRGDEYFCKPCESKILTKWLIIEGPKGVSTHLQLPYCPQCEKEFKIVYVPCVEKNTFSIP